MVVLRVVRGIKMVRVVVKRFQMGLLVMRMMLLLVVQWMLLLLAVVREVLTMLVMELLVFGVIGVVIVGVSVLRLMEQSTRVFLD